MNARTLQPNWAYWLAMYAASAFGTNLGDFWSDAVGLGLSGSLVSLAALSLALIALDRAMAARTELGFWLALVILRAMATNVGDYLTDDLAISRLVSAPALGALTLLAGYFTFGTTSPRVDARYWLALALGGAFGTVAGDLISHAVGLPLATGALGLLMFAGIVTRMRVAGAGVLSYWVLVLIERAAGTPAGDLLAEPRGLGLGLPVAMTLTGALFVLATLWRVMRPATQAGVATSPAR